MSLAQPMARPRGALLHGLLIILCWLILAFGSAVLAPYDPAAGNGLLALQPPSTLHWSIPGCALGQSLDMKLAPTSPDGSSGLQEEFPE